MKRHLVLAFLGSLLVLPSVSSLAADEFPFQGAIKARQAFMQVYSFNLGMLGAMVKNQMPYDADLASAAAGNLLAAAKMSNGAMWPQGSDNSNPELEGKTRAKPENWTTYPKSANKHKDLVAALETMVSVAGTGLDGVKGQIGAVGKGCKGCHEPFRAEKEKK